MKPVDCLPFWPKLGRSYPFARGKNFRKMTQEAMHEFIGSDKHPWLPHGLRAVRHRCSVDSFRDEREHRTDYKTPHGSMRGVRRFDEPSRAWYPVEFPIKKREDIALMTEVCQDTTMELDKETLEKARARVKSTGENGATGAGVGTTPLMEFVEHLAGVENAHLLLVDHTHEVEDLFEALQQVNVRRAHIMAEHSPADMLYMTENTSTTLISPDQFRRYCRPHLRQVGEILRAHDRRLVFHMCGHLKAVLHDIGELPASAVEAFTAPTLGNTTLMDGRSAMSDKCLVGGTQAPDWTQSAQFIIGKIAEALDPMPHHRGIVVTSAGVMPPRCEPETIKTVCEWVKRFPARM